jgi:hypothetical protein
MSKEQFADFVDLDLIHKFVKKNKVKELKIKKDINSIHFVFFFIFIVGFMGVIIFFRYLEKKRLLKIEKEKEEAERKERERALELSLLSLPPVRPNDTHVRNAVFDHESEKVRNEKEDELRKKMIRATQK